MIEFLPEILLAIGMGVVLLILWIGKNIAAREDILDTIRDIARGG